MTCLVLGPLASDETIAETDFYEENFRPVAEWLSHREHANEESEG